MPKLDMLTTQQVADYYEVPFKTAATCYERNKVEINLGGAPVKKVSDLKLQFEVLENDKAKYVFKIDENTRISIPNRGIRMFSKRAILRIEMLLRDSEIASIDP